MNTAVVFYSAQGNCALAAKLLSEKLGAQLVELKEKKPRALGKANLKNINASFMLAGFQAVFKIHSKLQGTPWLDVSDCAELHLITPIWAAKLTPAMNTFLAKCEFKGKKVFLYTVQADPNDTAKPARDALAETVCKKGGIVAGAHGLTGSAPGKEPKAELAGQIDSCF